MSLSALAHSNNDNDAPAQLSDFDRYSLDLSKHDVTITAPDSFRLLDMRGRAGLDAFINPAYPSGEEIYPVGIESADAKAVFLYPQIDFKSRKQVIRKGRVVEDELRFNRNDLALDVRPLIDVVALDDMTAYANADTAVIYQLKANWLHPFLSYKNIIGVYLRKYGHPAMLLKIALTDDAMLDKDKYVRLLLDNVRFGDEPFTGLVLQEQRLPGINDLDFPSPQYKPEGFIISPVEQALFNVWDEGGKEAYRIKQSLDQTP